MPVKEASQARQGHEQERRRNRLPGMTPGPLGCATQRPDAARQHWLSAQKAAQVVGQRPRCRVAVRRFVRDGLVNHGFQVDGDLAVDLPQPEGFLMLNAFDQLESIRLVKGCFQCNKLV